MDVLSQFHILGKMFVFLQAILEKKIIIFMEIIILKIVEEYNIV